MSNIDELLGQKLSFISEEKRQKLSLYYELVIEWNSRVNLTSIVEPGEFADKHFIDSLSAQDYIQKGARCIDVGTGAGLPGIPLAIVREDISLCLLDSLNKRVSFLLHACQMLGIKADCVHGRAEELAKISKHRERYDIALSRAVAPLNTLLELTVPFIRIGGTAILYKGKTMYEEVQAAQSAADELGASLSAVSIPADYGQRGLVLANKLKGTPNKYPRKPGEPSRRPL